MAVLVWALVIFTPFLLNFKLTYCMEIDFCIPVLVDHQNNEKHLHRRMEQMTEKHFVFRLSAFIQKFYLHLTLDCSFFAPESIQSIAAATLPAGVESDLTQTSST